MSKLLKRILYAIAGFAVLIILLLAIKIVTDNQYRSQLPSTDDLDALPLPMKEHISDAWKTADRNPTSRNLGRLGMAYHSSALYEKAAACYELAIKRSRRKWVWNYYLGYLDKEMGDNQGVIRNFTKVSEKYPGSMLAWYYIGEGYQAMGSYEKAEEVFNRIASMDEKNALSVNSSRRDKYPISIYARFQSASISMNTGQLDMAAKTLKAIIQEQPTFGQAYRLLGNIYGMKGNDSLSRKFVTMAGDLRVYTPPVDTLLDILALTSYSDLYLLKQVDDADKGGYPNFALELVRTGLLNMPDNKFVISKAIKLYLARGLDKLALPYLDKHLNDFSDDVNELRMVADLCMKRALYDKAINYYNQALKLQPDDIDLHFARILCLGNEGKKQDAIASINDLVKKNRSNVKVLTNAMYVLVLIGEKEKALSYLSELKQIVPGNPKVLQLSGMALEQEGENEKALAMYEKSFNGDPEDWATARYLGDILIKMKLWDRALSHYRKTLEHFPNDPYTLERLGTLLVMCPDSKLRNIREGREYSIRAFINKSSPPLTVISAGRCISESYAAEGDNTNAYKYLDNTISMAKLEKVPNDIIESLEKDLQNYK